MTKYRVRLKTGRVVGPFDREQIFELKRKSRIEGFEEIQIFPTGDWKEISSFQEFEGIELEKEVENEATFIKKINLEDLKKEVDSSSVDAFPKKFEYEKKTPFSDRPQVEDSIQVESIDEAELLEDPIEDVIEETVVEKKPVKEEQIEESDKTQINPNTHKYLEELKRAKLEDEKNKKLEDEKKKLEEPEVNLDTDSTQFINLDSLKSDLAKNIKSTEKEFKVEEKKAEKEKRKIEKEKEKLKLKASQMEEEDDDEEESPNKRKQIILLVAGLLLLYVFFTPDESEKKKIQKISFKYPRISFPIRFDKPDSKQASALYQEGKKLYSVGTYINNIKSSIAYRKSVENKFNGNPAAGKLIFLYSLLLNDSKDRTEDANTIFKLVQIFKTKALSEADYAAGLALFYLRMKKYNAAVNTFERYNTVKKSNPTVDLYAVHLRALLKTGDLIEAKKIAQKIETTDIKKQSMFVILSLINYYSTIGNYEKPAEIITTVKGVYKKSIPLNLERAKLLIYDEDFKSLEKLLIQLRGENLGESKAYYAKYLEYKGLLAIHKGEIERAQKFFQKALKTHESLELRSRLASLFEDNVTGQNELIIESKALQLVASSKLQVENKNWKFAFKDALEANRIAPNFIPAKIHLATLQIKQSLFKEAINNLESLYKQNNKNPEIVFTLVDAYIEAYKFTDVRRLLTILNTSELRKNTQYTSLTAKYYIYKEDFKNSVFWLQKAININPLNDSNLFELAKMYIKFNKFNKAKLTLNKAMDLDPAKVEYRIAYSSILYESDGADIAIAYLYNVLQDFPDNAKLLSQIGIFYYRSGQIKLFETIKKQLKSIPNKDTTLHYFLIEAAKLDDKPSVQIEESKKLISMNPGDLKIRLELGKLYMEMEKYKDALREFKAIENRLDTYPNLQLYMSNLYLLTDNLDKAVELAQKEIKANASGELGYILLGDIYSKQKNYIEAENQYKKAQRINGESVDMLLGLAKISFKKSQHDLALDLFLKARDNAPERAEIHKLLGDVYRKMAQSSLAIESYKLFLELSPTSKYKGEINTYIRTMQ